MNLDETKAVLNILRSLENELSKVLDRNPYAPKPFTPASETFATAADRFKELPFTPEEADTAIANVQLAIEQQEHVTQAGEVATHVINKLKELVPLFFTL